MQDGVESYITRTVCTRRVTPTFYEHGKGCLLRSVLPL